MKKGKCIALLASAALVAASVQAQQIDWNDAVSSGDWSNTANWDGGVVPNGNTNSIRILNPGGSINVNVDGDFPVNNILKSFSSYDPGVFLFDGPGTLTLDGNAGGNTTVINHAGGNDTVANVIEFGGHVVISNSLGGRSQLSFGNGDKNTIRFNSNSTLTLETELLHNDDSHGQAEFNGAVNGSANFNIWATTAYFGDGYDDSAYSGTYVFAGTSKLTIDGGSVGQALQVNSGTGELVLNAENAITDADVRWKDGLITVNASQNDMGYLDVDGALTIDLVGGGLAFDDSSARIWAGALTITNFTVGAISFGTDATGLDAGQLSQITAYDSGGALVTGLSLNGTGALIPEPSTIGLIALSGLGLILRRRMLI